MKGATSVSRRLLPNSELVGRFPGHGSTAPRSKQLVYLQSGISNTITNGIAMYDNPSYLLRATFPINKHPLDYQTRLAKLGSTRLTNFPRPPTCSSVANSTPDAIVPSPVCCSEMTRGMSYVQLLPPTGVPNDLLAVTNFFVCSQNKSISYRI